MKKLIILFLVMAALSKPVFADEIVSESCEEILSSEGVPYVEDTMLSLPVSYDARNLGLTTSIKDQGDTPFCLTYARIAALESALIKKGYESSSLDLSEMHMLYERWRYSGSTKSFGQWCVYSGNQTYGLDSSFDNSFQLRAFPVYESQMPMTTITDNYMPDTSYAENSPYEIDTIYLYKAPQDATDAEKIRATKEGIYRYGGVAANISYVPASESDEAYRFFGNGKDYSYYLPQKKSTGVGHVIEIVGWNDGYSKKNFSTEAPSDGAWLCKNSWGYVGGSSGYFWMSYYSKVSIIWEAFDVAKKGTTARGIELETPEITLYAGQTSDPVKVKMNPLSANPIEWYIDIPASDEVLGVNADNSITCKKFQGAGYTTDDPNSFTRTVRIRSKDQRLNYSAPLKITIKANTIEHAGTLKIPDTGNVDIAEGISVNPISARKSDVLYEKGSRTAVENNRYAIGRSYGKGSVRASLDGVGITIPCYVYCTGFDLGDDLTYNGSINAFLHPTFALDEGTNPLIERIQYTSSDESVARVDGECVYYIGNGKATITASLVDEELTNGITLTDTINVTVSGMDTGVVNTPTEPDPAISDPVIDNPPAYTDPNAYPHNVSNAPVTTVEETHQLVGTNEKSKIKQEKRPDKAVINTVKAKAGGKATVKWKKASGAIQYEIQISTDKGFKNAKSFYTKKTKYTVKSLDGGTKYYIRIRALGKTKSGKWSKKKSVWIK